MAGSATITGTQNYIFGIGHPKTEATTEAPPAVFETDPLTGVATALLAGSKQAFKGNLAPNFIATRVLSGQGVPFATSGNTYTWSLQVAVPHDFVAVRLIFSNVVLADITGVSAAVSAGGTLSDKTNNSGAWVNATFSEATTGTIPAAVSASDPAVSVSDWVPIESIARLDGGTQRLVYVRLMTPGANANVTINGFGSGGSAGIALWNSKADGFTWCSRFQVGDFVAAPTGMTASTEPQQTPIIGIQYLSKSAVNHYLAFGDSLTQCVQTTIPGDSWAFRALRDVGLPLGAFGWDGQASSTYLARAKRVIPILRPTHCFYPIFSPNDGTLTAAVMSAQLGRALQFAELCKENNCVPIFWTGMPRTTSAANTTSFFTIAQDDLRKKLNNAFLALGYDIADIGAAMSDTVALGVASKWKDVAYLTIDGIHPNDTGHAAMASVAALQVAKF